MAAAISFHKEIEPQTIKEVYETRSTTVGGSDEGRD